MAKKGVDINQASMQEIRDACGVGDSVAEAIIQAREEEPFSDMEEISTLPGVGETTMEKMKQHGCYVGGAG